MAIGWTSCSAMGRCSSSGVVGIGVGIGAISGLVKAMLRRVNLPSGDSTTTWSPFRLTTCWGCG